MVPKVFASFSAMTLHSMEKARKIRKNEQRTGCKREQIQTTDRKLHFSSRLQNLELESEMNHEQV